MSENRGSCYGLDCKCKDFDLKQKVAQHFECWCGHADMTHYYKRNGVDTKSSQPPADEVQETKVDWSQKVIIEDDVPVEYSVPVFDARGSKGRSEAPVEHSMTAGEARALLRKHNVQVGERGRLSPDQWKKAEELASK